jgi:hypothetical protein
MDIGDRRLFPPAVGRGKIGMRFSARRPRVFRRCTGGGSVPKAKSAFVHIGVGKTGTSSIQLVLGGLARTGRLSGIAVPSVAGNGQVLLPAAYQTADRLPRALRAAVGSDPERFRRELRAAWIEAIRARSSIAVSSEFLARFSDEEASAFHRDLVEAGYENIACLVYVREPAGLYLSDVQQTLKASASFTPPDAFRTGYRDCIERWRALCGGRITVRLFRPDALLEGDVVADFLARLAAFFGIERPRPRYRRQNESISAEGMILLQKYRRHLHPDADDVFIPASNRLLDLIATVEPTLTRPVTRPRLRDGVKRAVADGAAGDVAYLAKSFGIDIAVDVPEGRPQADVAPFVDVAAILDAYDPVALDELTVRLLGALLKSVPLLPGEPP